MSKPPGRLRKKHLHFDFIPYAAIEDCVGRWPSLEDTLARTKTAERQLAEGVAWALQDGKEGQR
jgi:hypothetical protein